MTNEFYRQFRAKHSDRSQAEIDYFVSRFNKMIDDNPGCSERQIANNLLTKLSGHKKWGGLSNQREDFANRTKGYVERVEKDQRETNKRLLETVVCVLDKLGKYASRIRGLEYIWKLIKIVVVFGGGPDVPDQ